MSEMRRILFILLWCFSFAAHAGESFGDKLATYYGDKKNYQAVKAEVMIWWGTTTNGCVAFASTALRELGIEVPLEGRLNGERISLLTLPFSIYLQESLHWKKSKERRIMSYMMKTKKKKLTIQMKTLTIKKMKQLMRKKKRNQRRQLLRY